MQDPRRMLGLQGASKFRDLGGYPGRDGRPLRWRRLFRSDHVAELTEADRATLRALGVTRAFDFRGPQERAAQPYEWPGLEQHSLSIEPTVAQNMAALAAAGLPLTAARMAELMEELYRRLVNDEADRFAQWFGHLLDDDAPLVFDCTAGKDRTGVAAALLLTNQVYRRPASAGSPLPEDALAVLWGVQPRFLDAALASIEQDHGGLESYLARRMALSPAARERLASMYLESDARAGRKTMGV